MPERFRENPQRPEAGECRHGNKEATCPECLKDAKALVHDIENTNAPRKPKKIPPTEKR